MIRRVKWAVLAAAMLLCAGGAYAQDCGCNQVDTGYNAYGQTGQNHYKHWYGHDRFAYNCGRGVTNGQAAALWAGYCHEDCSYKGENCGNCSLWGALKGCFHHGKGCGLGGCKTGCCGGGSQFGWPTGGGVGGGCGIGGGCGHGCGLFGHLKAKHFGSGDCCETGCDDCGPACGHKFCCKLGLGKCCFGKAHFGHGCGLFSKKFSTDCGCSDDYFAQPVGRGCFGKCCFRSHIRGRLTDCCCEGDAIQSAEPTAAPQPLAPQPADSAEPVFFSNEKGAPVEQSLDQILDGNEVIGGNYNRRN